jgi:dienelactone hydrolase
MLARLAVGTLFCVATVVGCASIQSDPQDIARTWTRAMVALPTGTVYARMSVGPDEVPARPPLPTVLHMHTCTGIVGDEMSWSRILTGAGYAVVMPDSFARKGRISDCDPATASGGLFRNAYNMRLEEIAYALPRLRALPWVDRRNVFLMGESEGGAAAALWGGGGFSAQVIIAWWCRHPDATLDGVRAPFSMPLLAVNHERDVWFPWSSSSCAARFNGYRDAREVVLSGAGHGVTQRPEAREAVLTFLRRHTVE